MWPPSSSLGQCWPRSRSGIIREWEHGKEGVRNQTDQLGETGEGYVSSFKVKGRWKDQKKLRWWSQKQMDEGESMGHCAQLTASTWTEVPFMQYMQLLMKAKLAPSRLGKWNCAWLLEKKLNKNHGFWVPIVWTWLPLLWTLSFLLSYITSPSIHICKMGIIVIHAIRGLQWWLNETPYN